MLIFESLLSSTPAAGDELASLELEVARRADKLMRDDDGRRPGRDFWLEAEEEVWTARLHLCQPSTSG